MIESEVEGYLVKRVNELGGWTCKFKSDTRGVPDRVVIFPKSGVTFIELKRPGEKPRPQQYFRMDQIRVSGGRVYWTDTKEGVDKILTVLEKGVPV